MSQTATRTVVYPIEITTREMDGVFLTALKLAQQGNEVYIGPKYELDYQVDNLKPELYIGTRATNDVLHIFKKVREHGGHVCIVDTEGGVFFDDFYVQRHEKEALDQITLFFASGQKGRDLLVNNGVLPAEKVRISGVPWFDLYELRHCYDTDKAKVQEQFPQSFIMFNSSLGNVNLKLKDINATGPRFTPEAVAYMTKQFGILNQMLDRLIQDFPEETFVLRPHPSENHETYHDLFGKYPNVYIGSPYNVRSWLLAGKMMIHNSCTTGIESALLKTPVIAYQEFRNPKYEMEVHNIASIRVPDYPSLVAKVKELLADPKPYELTEEQRVGVSRTMANVMHSASTMIVEETAGLQRKAPLPNPTHRKFFLSKMKYKVIYNYPGALSILPKKKRQNVLSYRDHTFKKFKPFDLSLLLDKQKQIAMVTPELAGVHIEKVAGMKHSYRFRPGGGGK